MTTDTIETPAPAVDQTALAIRKSIDQVEGALSEFDKISAGLAALEKAHPKNLACDVTTPKGMKEAIAGRAAWRDPRIAVEKARKAAKAPVLALGRDIDARASYITGLLIEGESNYDDQIKAEEARREAEKQAKIEQEQRRVAARQEAIAEIRGAIAAASWCGSANIAEHIRDVERLSTGPEFEEFQEQAKAAKDETLAQLRRMHAAALEREAEAARIAAEREELARLRAAEEERQRVERERIAAEQRAEAERLAAERAELERQQAAARAEQARPPRAAAPTRRPRASVPRRTAWPASSARPRSAALPRLGPSCNARRSRRPKPAGGRRKKPRKPAGASWRRRRLPSSACATRRH
jgi:colicin import membrane protein